MADREAKKSQKPTPPQLGSSLGKLLSLGFLGLAVYVGIALKSSYEIYDVRPFPEFPTHPLTAGLAPNNRLQKSEILLKGKILGPESIIAEGNKLTTGTHDGKIVEITEGKITKEFIMNPFCKTLNPRNCFRPLGMRRLNSKELIVADAYQGLYTVNMEEMSFKRILEANMLIDGEPMKFADDVDVIDEENVILSDASTRFTYHETIVDFNEGVPSGRVLHVNLRTKNVRVLTHGLYFANGVQLFPDKKSFLVCESLSGRVHRVYLEGEKKGKREVFVEGLPGIPDNVRLGKDGTFWVALAKARHPDKFDFAHFLKPHPMLRRLLISLFPHSWIYKATLLPTFAMIVQVSQTGEILSSLQDPTGSVVKGITQVTDDGEFLYLGSFYIDYVARVKK